MSGALRCMNRAVVGNIAVGNNVVATSATAAAAAAASQRGRRTLSTVSTTTAAAAATTTTTSAHAFAVPSIARSTPSPSNSGGGGCSGSGSNHQEGGNFRGGDSRNPSPPPPPSLHHHLHRSVGSGAAAGGCASHNGISGFREGTGGGVGGGGGGNGSLAPSTSNAKRMVSSKSSLLAPAASGGRTAGGARGPPPPTRVDAVVVGAGQAGLSVAYHLQKAGGLRFVTLDANQEAGGAWRHRWPSLELFSTRKWSSLPGFPMFANGACEDGYPSTREMAMYMEEYESVMKLNVVRPVTVTDVSRTAMGTFLVETDCLLGGTPARWEARTVVSGRSFSFSFRGNMVLLRIGLFSSKCLYPRFPTSIHRYEWKPLISIDPPHMRSDPSTIHHTTVSNTYPVVLIHIVPVSRFIVPVESLDADGIHQCGAAVCGIVPVSAI